MTTHDERAEAGLDLYWIPLGAGASVVQTSGKTYEALAALVARRRRQDLYHSALIARTAAGLVVIEMAPVPDDRGRHDRGVVAEGPVGARWLGRFRTFRYEIRRWPDGLVPDLATAVSSPVRLSDDPAVVQRVLDLVPLVPTPVWGRDESSAGDMWNSNSVVAWLLERSGLGSSAGLPPDRGRAPGWAAGVAAAHVHRVCC